MTRKTARTSLALASAVSITLLAACTPSGGGGDSGSDDGGDGPVELVWAIGGSESQPGGVNEKILEAWNKEHPDVQVRMEVLPNEADQQREQQALELQAEGSGFDILALDVIWTGEYSENGWLESLEDSRSDFEGKILEGPLNSAVWGGELWAAPYNSNAGFLYYRTDLVDTPPTTWDEMCTVAKEVGDANGIGGFIGQGAQYEGFVVNWLEHYWGAGGELLNDDQSEVLFDTDIATQTTQWYADGLKGGCFAPGFNTAMEEEGRNEFQEGNVVFMRNWPYVWSVIEGDESSPVHGKVGIAPLPTVSGEGTMSTLGGFNNAVSAFSEHKDEAKEFVTWLATDPVPQKMLATEASVPPVLAEVYDDPALGDDPVMSLLGEVLADAKPRPPAPMWNEISVEMQRAFFPAYNGEADPAQASEQVKSFLDSQIGH